MRRAGACCCSWILYLSIAALMEYRGSDFRVASLDMGILAELIEHGEPDDRAEIVRLLGNTY